MDRIYHDFLQRSGADPEEASPRLALKDDRDRIEQCAMILLLGVASYRQYNSGIRVEAERGTECGAVLRASDYSRPIADHVDPLWRDPGVHKAVLRLV